MKITIESTSEIVNADGIDCRVWVGATESGIQVHCLIPRIVAHQDADQTQFKAELQATRPPSEVRVFPTRFLF